MLLLIMYPFLCGQILAGNTYKITNAMQMTPLQDLLAAFWKLPIDGHLIDTDSVFFFF